MKKYLGPLLILLYCAPGTMFTQQITPDSSPVFFNTKTGEKLISKYRKLMNFPLTIEKLNDILTLATESETLALLARLDNLKEPNDRTKYIAKFSKALEKISDEDGVRLLEKLHEREKAGRSLKKAKKRARRALYEIRRLYIHLILANRSDPTAIKFTSEEPGGVFDDEDWYWFRTTKKDFAAPSRDVEQDLFKLLAKNRWDKTLLKEKDLSPLIERMPAGWPWKKFLAHFYKIHLMPKPEKTPKVLKMLCDLFSQTDIGDYVNIFKVNMRFAPGNKKKNKVYSPVIVLYVNAPKEENSYKKNAQLVLNIVRSNLAETGGSGVTPRYNKKINKLIFYAQGEGKLKSKHPSTRKKVLQAPEFALYRPDWVGDATLNFALV